MKVPVIGTQQPQFDINQAVYKKCECGCEYFDKVFKVGMISELAPGNTTRKEIPVERAVFICRKCEKESNPLENKSGK